MISCCFLPVVHAPLHDSHCFSCVTLHSSGTSRGKQAPGRSFSGKETVLITELPKVFDDSPPDTIVVLTVCLPKCFAQVFTAILVPGPNSFLEWAIKATANENCRGRNIFVIDRKNVCFTAFSFFFLFWMLPFLCYVTSWTCLMVQADDLMHLLTILAVAVSVVVAHHRRMNRTALMMARAVWGVCSFRYSFSVNLFPFSIIVVRLCLLPKSACKFLLRGEVIALGLLSVATTFDAHQLFRDFKFALILKSCIAVRSHWGLKK